MNNVATSPGPDDRPWSARPDGRINLGWFHLYAAEGRFLGLFLCPDDCLDYVRRRPPTEEFRLTLYAGGRAVRSWRIRSAFPGRVVSRVIKPPPF